MPAPLFLGHSSTAPDASYCCYYTCLQPVQTAAPPPIGPIVTVTSASWPAIAAPITPLAPAAPAAPAELSVPYLLSGRPGHLDLDPTGRLPLPVTGQAADRSKPGSRGRDVLAELS